MTVDPILQNLAAGAAAKGEPGGGVVRLVADGVVWQGRLVGPAAWADAFATSPNERDVLTELAVPAGASEYLHLGTASFQAGGSWHRAHGVRIAASAVTAWWRHTEDS